jgi:hypothetical protein
MRKALELRSCAAASIAAAVPRRDGARDGGHGVAVVMAAPTNKIHGGQTDTPSVV